MLGLAPVCLRRVFRVRQARGRRAEGGLVVKSAAQNAYEEVWADWGRSLVRQYPAGLGDEPDFSTDGTALVVWSMQGFLTHQKATWEVGEFKKYLIGDRTYTEYPYNSVEDQIYIARESFKLGRAYWYLAKKEAEEQAEKERQRAIVAKKREEETTTLVRQVADANTIQELEIRASALRERLRTTQEDESLHLHQRLSIVQDRLIALERRNTRVNMRWAIAGFIVGLIGIIVGVAFPVWDLTHRPQEVPHKSDQKTTSSAPSP